MNKVKKIAASLMAVTAMCSSFMSLPASATVSTTTVNKTFYVDSYSATASLNIGSSSTYYGASTTASSTAVTSRNVFIWGKCSNGNTITDSGASDTGYASAAIYASAYAYFEKGESSHSGKHGSVTGSTTMVF